MYRTWFNVNGNSDFSLELQGIGAAGFGFRVRA
jgi:hypothetical protein